MALMAFGILWGVGAVVFMITESRLQEMTYFDSLYFCFVALLSIGYGDYSAKSNIGKAFFVMWSLLAVPIFTVLIQIMSRTVTREVKRGISTIGSWTILPKVGALKPYLGRHPVVPILRGRSRQESDRNNHTVETDSGHESISNRDACAMTSGKQKIDIDAGCTKSNICVSSRRTSNSPNKSAVLAQLASSIKSVAQDVRTRPHKRYSYEQWAAFSNLIHPAQSVKEDMSEGEERTAWDWIGADSPLLANITEPEWVLDRLCESLDHYVCLQGGTGIERRGRGDDLHGDEDD